MNYNILAEKITGIDEAIAGVMIVRRGDLLGSYARPKFQYHRKRSLQKCFCKHR